MPNTPNLNGFRRTSPKSESETTRTRDSYENEKLKERIKMLENDQKQQNKENQILNLENKRLREENKRILDKHKVSFAQPTLDYAHLRLRPSKNEKNDLRRIDLGESLRFWVSF